MFIGRTDVEAETPILWPNTLMLDKIEGRRQRAYGKGKRLGSEKGGKQRRGTGCLVMLIMILIVISNINQIYEVPSALLNAPHG